MKYLLLGMMVFMLNSCETIVEVDVPEQQPKLVVFGFLDPVATEFKIKVRSSSPIFSDVNVSAYDPITNAQVNITGPAGTIQVPYSESAQAYVFTHDMLPVVYGGTYRVEVSASGYETVEGTTTIPEEIAVFTEVSAKLDSIVSPEGYRDDFYEFDLKWPDVSTGENFYAISFQQYTSEFGTALYDDLDAFNGIMTEKPIVTNTYSPEANEPIRVHLMHVTEDYYRYLRTATNIIYGDPFSEPTLVFSNIKNGLGCFTSYTSSYVQIIPE